MSHNYRQVFGVLVAVLADLVQFSTATLSFLGMASIPAHAVFSLAASAVLIAIMGPDLRLVPFRLLPVPILESLPLVRLFPSFTLAALFVARGANTKRLKPPEDEEY